MLSFDLSVIDIALATSVAVLFVLLFAQKRDKATTQPRSRAEEPKTIHEKTKAPTRKMQGKHSAKQDASGFQECIHFFGYLKNLPQSSPVPDECFGCTNVMQCLFSSGQATVQQEQI